ncbi:hypothetical protein DY218_16515 [Streptomyces triticagri]|uniref:Uncharacterized protein n=1 Tax=Streptomyces triticagri TaxID=2293568 RepID=A0A372M3P0_9ACTN|nr:hypothetical protein DY218_16515 [Streptomyces triticagri]
MAARRVQQPGEPSAWEERFRELQKWRAGLGLVISLGLYTLVPGIPFEFTGDPLTHGIITAAVITLLVPFVFGAALLAAHDRDDRALRPLLRKCAAAWGSFVGAVAVVAVLAVLISRSGSPWLLLAVPVIVWLVIFWAVSVFHVNRWFFGTGRVHAMLPPIILIVIVWISKLLHSTGGSALGEEGPGIAGIVVEYGGALAVTALAGAEIVLLRRHGLRFRTRLPMPPPTLPPGRPPTPAPQPGPYRPY